MAQLYRKAHGEHWPWHGVLLYVLPLPLVPVAIRAFSDGASGRLLIAVTALACFWAAAGINRGGLRAEAEYRRRKIAAAPRTPRKLLAAALLGAGCFVTTFALIDRGLVAAVLSAGMGIAGALLAYGADPRAHKGVSKGGHGYSSEEIIAALTEAEGKISAIDAASLNIRNAEFAERLRRIAHEARLVLSVIEEDPGDIRRARKFLNVYLDGAGAVAAGYAKTHEEVQSAELDSNFRATLETLESSFAQTRERLLEDDVMDLDVQIEVLKTRLEREGVL